MVSVCPVDFSFPYSPFDFARNCLFFANFSFPDAHQSGHLSDENIDGTNLFSDIFGRWAGKRHTTHILVNSQCGNANIFRLVKSSLVIYVLQIVVQCKCVNLHADTHTYINLSDWSKFHLIVLWIRMGWQKIYSTLFVGFLILTFAIVNYRMGACVRVCVCGAQKTRFMVIAKVLQIFMCAYV